MTKDARFIADILKELRPFLDNNSWRLVINLFAGALKKKNPSFNRTEFEQYIAKGGSHEVPTD